MFERVVSLGFTGVEFGLVAVHAELLHQFAEVGFQVAVQQFAPKEFTLIFL